MSYQMITVKGYDFFEVSSSMQKAIRRNDSRVAGYFALELWHSGYENYVWKRLFTVSAEDCYGLITSEIYSLYKGYELVNKGKRDKKGRIFISKAIILLCECLKSRDADHLQNFIYDKDMINVDDELEAIHKEEYIPIPDYAYDIHTKKGKLMGKTKKEFFIEEQKALTPLQIGLFDDLIETL
jgi:replication-associated recombination protein RarA